MIEDEELRQQYRAESAEHLQRIEQGLISLERDPSQKDVLEALLRDVHSLKGDARMLGLSPIEELAHAGEERLRPAYRDKRQLDIQELKRLYQWLDALRALTEEASGGPPADVDIEAQQKRLESGGPEREPEPVRPRETAPDVEDYRIETIRVSTVRLDSLLVDAGELAVTRSRLLHRLQELQETVAYLDEWGAGRRRGRGERAVNLGQVQADIERVYALLNEDLARLTAVTDQIAGDAQNLRLLPFSSLFQLFVRNVRDLAESEKKAIELVIEGGKTLADKRILEELKDPLIHLVRNAVHHGIETPKARESAGKPAQGQITLRAERRESGLVVEVEDDGVGLDLQRLKKEAVERRMISSENAASLTPSQNRALIFLPGLSTEHYITNIAGRGVGMDVVREKVEQLKGSVEVESHAGHGARFRLRLPLTIISSHVLLVRLGKNLFAIPTDFVQTNLLLEPASVSMTGGRPTLVWRGEIVKLSRLDEILELSGPESGLPADVYYCVILRWGEEYLGLLVDAVVDEQEVIIKPAGALLKRVRNVAGTSILGTGDICMVLNPQDLFASAGRALPTPGLMAERESKRSRILLVEDSLITRTQEARILESAGYEVVTAVDGLDALRKLGERGVDGVVTDILMPNMDGLTLTRKLREGEKTAELPVVLVTTLASEEDRRRGLEVGADAYIIKSLFEQEALLATLRRLIG